MWREENRWKKAKGKPKISFYDWVDEHFGW